MKLAKTVGSLAVEVPKEGEEMEGYIVQQEFAAPLFIAPSDLDSFTNVSTAVISQKQTIPFNSQIEMLRSTLESMYELVEADSEVEKGKQIDHIIVHREIRISQVRNSRMIAVFRLILSHQWHLSGIFIFLK